MFKGLGNLGNLASMMGSLQNLPTKLEELNERMKAEVFDAVSPCGRVTVTMNGAGQVQKVKIDPQLQGEELENLVAETSNAAGTEAKRRFAAAMSEMTQEMDLNLPGLDNILGSLTGR